MRRIAVVNKSLSRFFFLNVLQSLIEKKDLVSCYVLVLIDILNQLFLESELSQQRRNI